MKYVPFVAQVDAWKKAFSTNKNAKLGTDRKRWLVGGQHGEGEKQPSIQLVTQTQQAIDRARSEIDEMRKEGTPIVRYKPKTKKKKKLKITKKKTKKTNTNKKPKFSKFKGS